MYTNKTNTNLKAITFPGCKWNNKKNNINAATYGDLPPHRWPPVCCCSEVIKKNRMSG